MFEQKIIDNDDERFPGHTLIVGYQDGVEVWRSWAPEDIDPACRLSEDFPLAADERSDTKTSEIEYREPTDDERAALNGDAR